ncbi:toll-like receptor 8 [Trichonephila clavipes]|nr:toll-like receptor 8 [Trichonephila clavipes]
MSQNSGCPSKEDIKPCTCLIGVNKKPWISCEGLNSATELQNVLKRMQNYKFTTFNIEKSNLGVLPADIFSDVQIQFLNIMFTNLTRLSDDLNKPPFLGLESSLEAIEIQDGFTDEEFPLVRLSLSHLKKMTLLQLEGNILPTISNDWFESGPYRLRELHLLDTYAKQLGSHVFSSLSELRKLSLTGGHISELTRNMFPSPAIYLESLDLNNNKLAILPNDMFYRMPSLKEVFLENNDFTKIDEVVFAPVWSQISHVFFYGNPLNCNADMKWIYKYRIPESIQGHCASPPSLRYRSLSNLTITDFE